MNCIYCHNSEIESTYSVISPWIRELGVRKKFSKYLHCQNCGGGFFNYRYSPTEMSLIYSHYRGEHYLKVRSKWEPWYSNTYNQKHDDQEWIEGRKKSIKTFLAEHGLDFVNSVVDIGGDRGQYIPDLGAKDQYVDEVSGKQLVPNVKLYSSRASDEQIDLAIYAHVLEHVHSPFEEIVRLLKIAKYVYIEVPYGVPVISRGRRNIFKFAIHLIRSFSPSLWRKTTLPATGRNNPGTRIITQSEHLSFFTEDTIRWLATKIGAQITVEKSLIQTPDLSEGQVLQCLINYAPGNSYKRNPKERI